MANQHPANIAEALVNAEIQYGVMVDRLRAGDKFPHDAMLMLLELAERRPEDLIRDALSSDSFMPRAGGPCLHRECNGRLDRYWTKRRGQWVTRYFKCRTCGTTTKRVLPSAVVPCRRPKVDT